MGYNPLLDKLCGEPYTGNMDISETIAFAVKAHAGQARKNSGCPYIVHPMAVLAEIANWGITNVVTWETALCHDILEDCAGMEYANVAEVIGTEAADAVVELSFFRKVGEDTKAAQKERYLASFSEKSIHALVCKVADRICNTRDFIEAGDPYAAKYWGKASGLLDAMKIRGEEIGEFFKDEKVFPRMEDSTNRISMMML